MFMMFRYAFDFNQDIGGWVVDSVTDMNGMFHEAEAFNQDIGDWAVHCVTDMGYMFQHASAFDQDLGWCIDNGYERFSCYGCVRGLTTAFEGTKCESTSCGVVEQEEWCGVFHSVSISKAVDAWLADATAAESTYGHIST